MVRLGVYIWRFPPDTANESNDITNSILDGQLKSLLDLCYKILPNFQSALDRLNDVFTTQLNTFHNQGTAFPPSAKLTATQPLQATNAFAATGNVHILILNNITGDVVNNGTLAFVRSDSHTFSGTISGTGGIIKEGSGTLTLTGTNDCSGETTISEGTLVLDNLGRVRLIGMNTPETVAPVQRQGAPPQCYGPEASAATKALLPKGTSVRLETDKAPRGGGRRWR